MARKTKSISTLLDKGFRIHPVIMVPLLMIWLSILYSADSYFSPYVFFALLCLLSCAGIQKQNIPFSKREKTYSIIFSAFFSLAIGLANYKLISPLKEHLLSAALLFAVGFIVGHNILALTLHAEPWKTHYPADKQNVRWWFLFPFCIFLFVYLLTLFFCCKPGILTYDSIFQINEIFTNSITNHHPFLHTMVIKLFLDLGMFFFKDINLAVEAYSVFQLLCMAAIFAYICMTLYQAGTPKIWLRITVVCFAFLPYHIFYSMTMWKDILFAGSVSLFSCALFRMIKKIGGKRINYSTLILGAFGCCLLRSNGQAAFIFTFIILAIFLRKQEKNMLFVLLTVIVVAFIFKYPILKALHIRQPNLANSLSIPLQQFARLIVDDVNLSESELSQIEQIMDPDEVRKNYTAYISDPIKRILKSNILLEHKWDYFVLWLRLGLKHPATYLHAWIDQTRGYWNGGYDYWILGYGVHENNYGIKMFPNDNAFGRGIIGWINNFLKYPAFELLRSIGLHVWITLLWCMNSIIRKRKEWLIFIMPIANILTLLISTPVFCEFRYAYAIFTTFPLLVLSPFISETGNQ